MINNFRVPIKFIYGSKAAGREKVLQMSQNSPHSKSPSGQTVGPSNMSFGILGNLYELMLWLIFHLPGMPGNVRRKALTFPEIPGNPNG